MAEYIDREALGVGFCNPDVFDNKGYAKGWNAAIDIIKKAPAADVREVVKVRWVPNVPMRDLRPRCSACGVLNPTKENFCPNCGADMKEEKV